MNRILSDIVSVIKDELSNNLLDVKQSDLENDGAVFYMNGKNGTEFDWFVNEHLPSFMVFMTTKRNWVLLRRMYMTAAMSCCIFTMTGEDIWQKKSRSLLI